jgi:hypothetical protein
MPASSLAPNAATKFTNYGSMAQFNGQPNMLNQNGGAMSSVGDMTTNRDGTSSTSSKLEAMKPYFGVAQKQTAEQPYSWWDSENYDLPDGLKGKCTYVLNILITAILTSDMWPVTEMLPYKKKGDMGLTIQWDEWHFNDSLLDRTPEESVSRMTTSSFDSFSAHLVRRGKAFILEHGFWLTPMGQKNWAMNVVQIVNATTETACYGASHCILTTPPYKDVHDRFHNGGNRNKMDIDSMMIQQTDSFARIQKEEGGLQVMVSKMRQTFLDRNTKEANYLILPAGCSQAVAARPENNYAVYNGVGRINQGESNLNQAGLTVRTSRGYRQGEHQPNVDPHFSTVCIGGFHVFTNQAANMVPIEEYRSLHRNIVVFSMSKDDYVTLDFDHYFEYLGLYHNWQSAAPELSHIGHQFLSKYSSWGSLLEAAGEIQRAMNKINLISSPGSAETAPSRPRGPPCSTSSSRPSPESPSASRTTTRAPTRSRAMSSCVTRCVEPSGPGTPLCRTTWSSAATSSCPTCPTVPSTSR